MLKKHTNNLMFKIERFLRCGTAGVGRVSEDDTRRNDSRVCVCSVAASSTRTWERTERLSLTTENDL